VYEEDAVNKLDNRGRVVVGVDGSAGSLAALRFAFDEARRRATGLRVVTAFELPDVWSITYGLSVSATEQEVRDSVLQHTRRVVTEALGDQLTADGAPDVDVAVQGGGAARVLVSAAAGSPLLVVGSRGLGGFRRMLLGSVSLQCVQHAPCPVTVVRSAVDDDHTESLEVDSTAADALAALHAELERRGVVFAMARAKQDLRDQLARAGLIDTIGEDR
jgi:nucleotide-binding universal stress UspA family protein